ncbi:hypothetical protein BCR34DRAFT_617321 [Clohesyomyces aquaticus]|uniref:Uncharacterized protein n=1 Tax=Clohesyomyces aquaticus TaxID=1231657 RepID=A0A1Y1Z410_9PLEO|nr:hypothetical protein BCR34DRAFT_617321 [Clohesyomyces aquaticus]
MNTIAPAPAIKKLPPGKRALGIFLGLLGGSVTNVALGYAGFSYYSRQTKFVPYDGSDPDLSTPVFRKHNPAGNKPICIDHAVKTIPLDKLKTRDTRELTTGFCRGVWSGLGFAYQRRWLEKRYRALEGREGMLWERSELAGSRYEVGTRIADHFEVVEHTDDKVIVRCGDSPLVTEPRASDGLFSMEVTKDEEKGTATFHLKSVFVNTTPEGKGMEPLPWHFQFAHRWYTKLWMETATRKLLK